MPLDSTLLASLGPEARLLLLSAGGADNDQEMRRTAAAPLDWARLLAMAEGERATAILWRRLESIGVRTIPAAERVQFERLMMISDFKALYLKQRLDETLAVLGAAGVDVVLLKGAALGSTVYGSFVERPMGDLDLLVDAARAEEAHALARRAGWTWNEGTFPAARYEGHHHLPPLYDERKTGAKLELHTGLFIEGHPFALSGDDLRAAGRRLSTTEGIVFVPSPEHELLHLCVHFAWSHMMGFGAWRMFRDLDALSRSGLDWQEVLRLAAQHRAVTSCYWTFRLAEALAGVSVPADVMRALRAPSGAALQSRLERHLVHHVLPTEVICPAVSVRRMMWSLALQPRQSGHGPVRPWDLDAPNQTDPGKRGSRLRRIWQQASRLGAWRNYMRLVVAAR